jgi:GT2 family glycosyltransferase
MLVTPLVELELKGPLTDFGPFPGAEAVLALLRWRGRPVGLLRVPTREGWVRAPQWQATLAVWCQQPATRAALAEPGPLSGPAPALSIVITTHERPAALRRCLAALDAARPLQPCELILVDSNPTSNGTVSVAASLAATGTPVRYVCEPRPGRSHARNAGWHAARHPLVAFLDDDAVPEPAWAGSVARALAAPQVAAVAGLVLPLALETPAQALFEAWQGGRRGFTRRELRVPPPGLPPQPVIARRVEALAASSAVLAGQGGNLALRREWLVRAGGFDQRLDAGAEADLLARVLEAGGRLVYLPEASIRQPSPADPAALHRAVFEHGAGQASFALKRLSEAGRPQAAFSLLGRLAAAWLSSLRPHLGNPPVPLSLRLSESAGCLVGPVRFWRASVRERQAHTPPYPGPQPSQKTS